MQQLVTNVVSSDYSILKSNPPKLFVFAIGETPTLGWTKGQLIPWVYIVPPADGLLDMDFYGERPDGMELDAIGQLNATHIMDMPAWVQGYRIHTANPLPFIMKFNEPRIDKSVPDPRNEEFYIEAGIIINGFAGYTISSKIATKMKLYSYSKDVTPLQHYEDKGPLRKTAIRTLYEKSILDEIRNSNNYGVALGPFYFITFKEGDKIYKINWAGKVHISDSITEYHKYLYAMGSDLK